MDLSVVLKIVVAAVLGGMVGIERQLRGKPAGLRTNMLICIGAAQFTVISTTAAQLFGGDPTRIAAQIVTGIGFLGAGAVLHANGYVKGLTTAATIWVVAGIGMAVGNAMYVTASTATVLTIGTLYLLSIVERQFPTSRTNHYSVHVDDLQAGLAMIDRRLGDHRTNASDLAFRRDRDGCRISFNVSLPKEEHRQILTDLSAEPMVRSVETGKGEGEFQEEE